MTKKVVYNHKPDPVISIKEYKTDKNGELVFTGRHAHPKLIERADLVTEMKKIKHHFDKGIRARIGIEF